MRILINALASNVILNTFFNVASQTTQELMDRQVVTDLFVIRRHNPRQRVMAAGKR